MHYEEGGDGIPLVYVHGGNTSLLSTLHYGRRPFAWRWRQDFVERFRFLWYERRGCYRSGTPDDGYDMESQARDLLALLNHLAIERAHLVGMSAGGPIAVVFAATHPYRVRSLALVSTGLNLWSRADPKLAIVREQYALLRREGPGAAFDRRPTDAAISLDALWERDEAIWDGTLPAWEARQRALLREASYIPRDERVRRYAAELRDMMAGLDVDLRTIASRVAAPTIVFHGGADRIIPMESAQELAAGIPNARWKCFVGEGHQMLFTNQHVRRAVIRFATHH